MARVIPRTIRLRPMSDRPSGGRIITVCLLDGTQLVRCFTTMIHQGNRSWVMIYHDGKAIDESLAAGWWGALK